jgi:RNA polymerase sigma-70 factor (ECF subfamily)
VLPAPAFDDGTLCARLAERDPIAAAAFYDRFQRDVNRLVWRLLGADPDHHDLVQQVFCKLLEKIGSVRDPATLSGWVQLVTVNTVYSELRRRRVRRFWSRAIEPADDSPAVHATPETRELLRRAYELLALLPAADHVAFVLHYVDERSLREVADLTGASTATVKRRIARARAKLHAAAASDAAIHTLLGGPP